jgi:hypothetical protein
MNKKRILCFVIAILLGIFMFVFAGIDDSPGGQMIGLLAVIIGIVGVIRNRKKTFDQKRF